MARSRARGADTTIGLAQGLGWFSLGLGMAQLLAPHAVSRSLGLRGQERLVASYGAREIVTGIGILASRDPTPWIWGRVAGDALDIGTLAGGLAMGRGRERSIAGLAIAAVAGITLLDVLCGRALSARKITERKRLAYDYSSRRGMPKPAAAMRGAASDFEVPRDFRIPEPLRPWGSVA
ncbi:cyclase dehydrase [Dankookia sp. GCM10030260]|uniref:cyclase dehydrase n=1 Tax=Dankookia sp. GCM10030260 TaxID=3273390 RepID=UPI003606813F